MDLKEYWKEGISYERYKQIIEENPYEGDFIEYTKQSLVRIERNDKTLEFHGDTLHKIQNLSPSKILIISEGWCGDASQIVPVINKIEEINSTIELRIVFRDKNDLIDNYLTNGGKSIPIIIALDPQTYEEKWHWGPRPKQGNELLKKYKKNPEIYTHNNFIIDVQDFYNKDKGISIINELFEKDVNSHK